MRESQISFLSQNRQLLGVVHYPTVSDGNIVIMCHGFTGDKAENKRLFVEAARSFAVEGFVAFRFDFFGSGDSSGKFSETRLSINIQNLKDAIKLVGNWGYKKIFILGISMGAATSILTLEKESIDGTILWSTVPDFRKLFESKLGMPLEKTPVMDSYEYDGWLIERDFYLDALQYNISNSLKNLKMPKLIVGGTNDESVFTQGFEDFKSIAKEPVEFSLIENAGHTFETIKHRKEVIQVTLDWLKRQNKK
jgi:uncharacterized protein